MKKMARAAQLRMHDATEEWEAQQIQLECEAPSAEALRRKQLADEEEAVLADLRELGELVRLDLSDYHADGTFAWAAANRGDGKGWGRHHSYETIDRLMHRGEVVLLGDDGKGNHTRCRLAPRSEQHEQGT